MFVLNNLVFFLSKPPAFLAFAKKYKDEADAVLQLFGHILKKYTNENY